MGPSFDHCNSIEEVLVELSRVPQWYVGPEEEPGVTNLIRDVHMSEMAVQLANERIKEIHRADMERMFDGRQPPEYHDENTLTHVYDALATVNIGKVDAEIVVTALQNHRILFRERR